MATLCVRAGRGGGWWVTLFLHGFFLKVGSILKKTGKSITFSVAIVVSTCFEILFSSSSPYFFLKPKYVMADRWRLYIFSSKNNHALLYMFSRLLLLTRPLFDLLFVYVFILRKNVMP